MIDTLFKISLTRTLKKLKIQLRCSLHRERTAYTNNKILNLLNTYLINITFCISILPLFFQQLFLKLFHSFSFNDSMHFALLRRGVIFHKFQSAASHFYLKRCLVYSIFTLFLSFFHATEELFIDNFETEPCDKLPVSIYYTFFSFHFFLSFFFFFHVTNLSVKLNASEKSSGKVEFFPPLSKRQQKTQHSISIREF